MNTTETVSHSEIVIDWNVPGQLVYNTKYKTLMLTSGQHDGNTFEGTKIHNFDPSLVHVSPKNYVGYYSQSWIKDNTTLYTGTLSISN